MTRLIHPPTATTVGRSIKKALEINPELGVHDLIKIIKESVQTQGKTSGEFASAEVVDEEKVLNLARMKEQKN